ncbi:MAG: alpha/beta hydrolase family protein [Gemmatimonadales bacterium]
MRLAPLDMFVPAGDGLVLRGTLTYPEGRAGAALPLAVLAHQYPTTRDSFSPLVDDLLAMGVATLAFDERGHGASTQSPDGQRIIDTPQGFTVDGFGTAFAASAKDIGFGRIEDDVLRVAGWGIFQNFIDRARLVLVGASVGGPGVLLAAPRIPGIRAVVTLGAAGAPAYGEDGPARVRSAVERISAPCFLASSRDDPFGGAANVTAWGRDLSHVTSRVVPGDAHAMAIYFDVWDELLAFVRRALVLG